MTLPPPNRESAIILPNEPVEVTLELMFPVAVIAPSTFKEVNVPNEVTLG